MNLRELKAQLAALKAQARSNLQAALTAGRALTEEERTADDRLAAEISALDDSISRFERQLAEEVADAQAQEARGEPSASRISGGHDRAADRPFASLGEQMQAIYAARVQGDATARARLMAVASGSQEAVDSDGGYLVQADLAAGVERRMHATGTLLGLMSPLEVSGNGLVERQIDETSRADGSRSGGVRGYWVNEAAAATASRPKFRLLTTPLQKVAALGYSTDELLEDFPAMSNLFEQEFAEELVFKVEDSVIEGDGASMPLGILNAPCLVTQAKEAGQAADTFLSENISQMWNRLAVRSRSNAVWLINQELEPQLDVLSIPAGTAALEPRYVTYGPDGVLRIKGRPVVVLEYCSALGDLGDVILADMTQYRWIRKGGVQQASSMHVLFTTDEMAFRATYRVGGQPKWAAALTPFKATASRTVSPFVTLAAR